MILPDLAIETTQKKHPPREVSKEAVLVPQAPQIDGMEGNNLQNAVPLIYMTLNNKSIYCDMTRSSKPSNKVDLSGPVFCSCASSTFFFTDFRFVFEKKLKTT